MAAFVRPGAGAGGLTRGTRVVLDLGHGTPPRLLGCSTPRWGRGTDAVVVGHQRARTAEREFDGEVLLAEEGLAVDLGRLRSGSTP